MCFSSKAPTPRKFLGRLTAAIASGYGCQVRGTSHLRCEACEKGRLVSLFSSEDDLVGATEDEQQGLWQLQLIGERYYSEVLKRVEGPSSHRHVCDPDRSPTTP